MAITSVELMADDMTITDSLSDGATGVVKFIVLSDIMNESPAAVMNATGIPALGTAYPGAPEVLLHEKSPARIDPKNDRKAWHVTCNYKSILSQDERDRKDHPNPLDRKSHIFWKSRKVMKTYRAVIKRSAYYKTYTAGIESTFNMKSATNSASDFFEPVLEYPSTEWIAVITKNVATIPDWFLTYEDAVNDADYTINFYGQTKTIKKGCSQLGAISLPVAKQENGYEYVQLSFEIVIGTPREARSGEAAGVVPEPFDQEILDTGMRRRIVQADIDTPDPLIDPALTSADLGKWMNIKDAEGFGVTLPVPFDSLGKPVATPGYAIAEDQLWYSLVAPYKRKSFSILASYLGP